MSVTDSIGDMLTIIRNGNLNGFASVDVLYSQMSEAIVNVLAKEGFLKGAEKYRPEKLNYDKLKVHLKYGPSGEKIIHKLDRVSKPGKRIFYEKSEIPRLKNGYGMVILTTSKGVLSGRDARLQNVGGEAICNVW